MERRSLCGSLLYLALHVSVAEGACARGWVKICVGFPLFPSLLACRPDGEGASEGGVPTVACGPFYSTEADRASRNQFPVDARECLQCMVKDSTHDALAASSLVESPRYRRLSICC